MTSTAVPSPQASSDGAIRAAVNLLAIAAFFSGAALRICDGLLPRLAADFGVTTGVAGRVVLTFAISYGCSQLVFGPLGDRFGKTRMVCVALFGGAFAALACTLAPGFDALVRLRILWGIMAAGIIPTSIAWIGDAVPYEQRQATLARLLMGTLSGMTAGQLAGGLFADSPLGWRGAFGALSAGYLIVGILLLARVRSIPSVSAAQEGSLFAFAQRYGQVLSVPWARAVLALVMAEGVFLLGALAFLPAYVHEHFGLSLSASAAIIALYALGGVVYALVAKQVVRRFGERRMALAGGILMGLGFVGWYLTPTAWIAGPIALLVGFGTYLYHNTLQTNATQMAPAMRGTGMAMFAFCFFIGQAIGVSAAGYAYDHGGPAPLLLVPAAALPVLGWLFAQGLRRRQAA